MAVADAMPRDAVPDVVGQRAHERALQVLVAIEVGEAALSRASADRGPVGRMANRAHGVGRNLERRLMIVPQAEHDQGVGKASDAETDPPRALRLAPVQCRGFGAACRLRICGRRCGTATSAIIPNAVARGTTPANAT
jgi:hypothetical protein